LITVQRAYEELESEGVIRRQHGLGTFVSDNGMARSAQLIEQEAAEFFRKALDRAREAGMGDREIKRLFNHILKEEGEWK
ncbi:MAG: GntR family transcriptional regulator, partial [Candidatus Omnitrophica bacterium]|nr:GntR family transcriptional regulator [Candidatus Omnitrophota bacterium]